MSVSGRIASRRKGKGYRKGPDLNLLPTGLGAMTEWSDVVGLVVQKYDLRKKAEETQR